jgi:hypothetical protein
VLDLDLDLLQVEVEIEYVPEKAELDDPLLHDFKAIFEKFTFKDAAAAAAEVFGFTKCSSVSRSVGQ